MPTIFNITELASRRFGPFLLAVVRRLATVLGGKRRPPCFNRQHHGLLRFCTILYFSYLVEKYNRNSALFFIELTEAWPTNERTGESLDAIGGTSRFALLRSPEVSGFGAFSFAAAGDSAVEIKTLFIATCFRFSKQFWSRENFAAITGVTDGVRFLLK